MNFLLLTLALVASGVAQEAANRGVTPGESRVKAAAVRRPDGADLRYGPHERNVLDIWTARSTKPTPLILYIHGGGFATGDKNSLTAPVLQECLAAGYAVAALNYRLTETAPAPAAYLDCARALQYLRFHAHKWNLDPELVAAIGSSAGAGIAMWLAFHDDLADPRSADPIGRQSTRLRVLALTNGQPSYDPRYAEQAGLPRPNFERHSFFLPFYGIPKEAIDTPAGYRRYEAAAPITFLSRDDPPVMLTYSYENIPVTDKSPVSLVVHHPRLGLALKARMETLGVECVVQYRGQDSTSPPVRPLDFIRKHLERGKAKPAD